MPEGSKEGPRTTSNGKFSFFRKKFVFEGGRYFHVQINSDVRKDQKQALEPLRMENFHFSGRSSFLKEADTFMCKSIAVSGRIKSRP